MKPVIMSDVTVDFVDAKNRFFGEVQSAVISHLLTKASISKDPEFGTSRTGCKLRFNDVPIQLEVEQSKSLYDEVRVSCKFPELIWRQTKLGKQSKYFKADQRAQLQKEGRNISNLYHYVESYLYTSNQKYQAAVSSFDGTEDLYSRLEKAHRQYLLKLRQSRVDDETRVLKLHATAIANNLKVTKEFPTLKLDMLCK